MINQAAKLLLLLFFSDYPQFNSGTAVKVRLPRVL
jgi:hypothetical protein